VLACGPVVHHLAAIDLENGAFYAGAPFVVDIGGADFIGKNSGSF